MAQATGAVTATVAGREFHLSRRPIERALAAVDPEPIQEHYAVVDGRRFPPKQVLAIATGLDRADFTTHQARAVLRRLGFGVHRRSATAAPTSTPVASGPHGGSEAAVLDQFKGRWVAQVGLEIIFDADTPEAVVRWLHRHRRRARVWRVPATPADAGSTLSAR